MGSSKVDVNASGLTLFDAMPNQVLVIRILRDNGQDQIVLSGNYCWSYISLDSIDDNKNTAIERLQWHTLKQLVQTTSLFARVKKEHVRLRLEPWHQCLKISYRAQTKTELLKCKRTLQIAIFTVRTLNRIGQLPKLSASVIDPI